MKRICTVFILIHLIFHGISFAGENLVMGQVGCENGDQLYRTCRRFLDECSKRMDVTIELICLPSKRATTMFKEGKIHAEFSRIPEYKEELPSALRVDEPIAELTFHAYSLASNNLKINGLKSIQSYKIVVVRDLYFVNVYLKNYNIHHVNFRTVSTSTIHRR